MHPAIRFALFLAFGAGVVLPVFLTFPGMGMAYGLTLLGFQLVCIGSTFWHLIQLTRGE